MTALLLLRGDSEAVSASADGSCLFWSLARGVRLRAVFATTVFRALAALPDGSQLVTAGSDRRIAFWHADSATALRAMDGSTDEVRLRTRGG